MVGAKSLGGTSLVTKRVLWPSMQVSLFVALLLASACKTPPVIHDDCKPGHGHKKGHGHGSMCIDAGNPDDAATPEDAGRDSGPVDAAADAGPVDAGGEDASVDAGGRDAGPADAGPDDAGPDAAVSDAGTDAGPEPDAGPGDGIDDLILPPAVPLVTAIGTPIPGEGTSAVIGAEGGSVMSVDGRLVLTIPAGALSMPTTIGIATITNEIPTGIGEAFSLTPEGQTFAVPITVSMRYDPPEIDHLGTTPEALAVSVQAADGSWESPPTSVDTIAQTVSVQITHFSGFLIRPRFVVSAPPGVVFAGSSLGVSARSCRDHIGPLNTCPLINQTLTSWAVNGIPGGNASVGTITSSGLGLATYTAPSSIPTNPMRVHVSVRGRVGGRVIPFSVPVLVVDGFVWKGQVSVFGANAGGSIAIRSPVTFVFPPGATSPVVSEGVTGYTRYRETRIGTECTLRVSVAPDIGADDGSLRFDDLGFYDAQGATLDVPAPGVSTCTSTGTSGGGTLPIGILWWPPRPAAPFGPSSDPNVIDDEFPFRISGIDCIVFWHLERIFQ
jgi:hypothetical protein